MADTNGDTFWKWATGVLVATVGYLWRMVVKKDDLLINEKESRIHDKDRHIKRLEEFERKAKQVEGARSNNSGKRRTRKDRRPHRRPGDHESTRT